MIDLLDRILGVFGYEIVYEAVWDEYINHSRYQVHRVYKTRYDAIDSQIGLPIHIDMSTAPPWAKAKVRRINAQ